MAKHEQNINYRKRQHILICCLSVLFVILLLAAVMFFVTTDNEPIRSSTGAGQENGIQADAGNDAIMGSLYFEESEIIIKPGEARYAKIVNKTGIEDSYIWSSSNVSVAFAEDGVITGVAEGSCDITVKIGGTDHTAQLHVYVEGSDRTEAPKRTEPTEATEPTTESMDKLVEEEGLTYIDGILIANKTYSLPADYDPGESEEALAAFDKMQSDAANEGLNIYISSGYRSYYDQERIYNNYVAEDGKELADTYSSRPGHSDHQTGLAFDLNSIDDSFGYTPESDWVAENAHKYGFIIRFPEGKDEYTGYQYEPWHIRYLGVEKAKAVYESGLSLEEYLGISSKYQD